MGIPFHSGHIRFECPPLLCVSRQGHAGVVTVCDFSKSGLCNKNNGMSGAEIIKITSVLFHSLLHQGKERTKINK